MKPTMYHIPVCPFSQRVEILLELKGMSDQVDFQKVDITVPRPDWLLEKSGGTTSLPLFDLGDGRVMKESLVILRYLDRAFPESAVTRQDPWEAAIEDMLIALEGSFCMQGYTMVMNQDPAQREAHLQKMYAAYENLNAFLMRFSPDNTFLFEKFGLAEAVFTPFFMRFWFLDYYENFELPAEPRFERVRRWKEACLAHPAAQQVTKEEIVKVYYDYARGAGNGKLLPGRTRSSFEFEPHWSDRPWPPRDKYGPIASDEELGLL